MGTTPNNSWPYPESSDYVADGATAIQNLADAIDGSIGVWEAYSPTSSWDSYGSFAYAKFTRIGYLMFVKFRFNVTAGSVFSATFEMDLPDGIADTDGDTGGMGTGAAFDATGPDYETTIFTTSDKIRMSVLGNSSPGTVTGTSPFNWINGDSLRGLAIVEVSS